MRVLHLISSCGLFGAENVVLTLARNFNANANTQFFSQAQERIDSIVGAISDIRDPHIEIIEQAKQKNLPTLILESSGRFDWKPIFQLKKYLLENHIDLLHTHNYKSDILGAIAARLVGIPIVATAHGYTDINHTVTSYEKLDRFVLRHFFYKIAVVTDKMLSDFPDSLRHIIPNGLDVDRFSGPIEERLATRRRQRAQWGIKEDDTVVATIGRLSKEKNQVMFLRAASTLKTRHPKLRFVIGGAGPEEGHLRQLTSDLDLTDRVIFTGLIKDVAPVYQGVDIFALTSLTEGVPITILEAMAAQVPVIATGVGGIPEMIIDNQTGLLCDSEDVTGFVAKVEVLLNQPHLQRAISRAAYDYVKNHFSTAVMLEKYSELYRAAMNAVKKGK